MAAVANTPSNECEKIIHFNITAKVIDCLLGSQSTDCTFKFGDKEIKVHRKLLSGFSSVFANRFATRWANNLDPIHIVDASYENYVTFLEFFYKGEIKLTLNNVMAILFLARKFNVEVIISSCSTYAIDHLSIQNVFEYYGMAIRLSEERLQVKCAEFVKNNTECVVKSKGFLQCDRGMLKKVLQMDKPCKEAVVINACFEWAKEKCRKKGLDFSQPTNLREQLSDCFSLIRFKKMESYEFAELFKTFKEMFSSEESTAIFLHFLQTQQQQTCSIDTQRIPLELEETHSSPTKPNEIIFSFDREASTIKRSTKIQFVLNRPLMLKGITVSRPHSKSGAYLSLNATVNVTKQNGKRLIDFSTKTIGQELSLLKLPTMFYIPENKLTTIQIDLGNVPYEINMNSYKISSTQWNSVEICFPEFSTPSFIAALVFTRPQKKRTQNRALSEAPFSKNRKMGRE